MGFLRSRWLFLPLVIIAFLTFRIITLGYAASTMSLTLLMFIIIAITIFVTLRRRREIKDQMPTELDRYVDPRKPPQPGDSSFVKTFDYYCPHCLFQTNEDWGKCPECHKGMMKETE